MHKYSPIINVMLIVIVQLDLLLGLIQVAGTPILFSLSIYNEKMQLVLNNDKIDYINFILDL